MKQQCLSFVVSIIFIYHPIQHYLCHPFIYLLPFVPCVSCNKKILHVHGWNTENRKYATSTSGAATRRSSLYAAFAAKKGFLKYHHDDLNHDFVSSSKRDIVTYDSHVGGRRYRMTGCDYLSLDWNRHSHSCSCCTRPAAGPATFATATFSSFLLLSSSSSSHESGEWQKDNSTTYNNSEPSPSEIINHTCTASLSLEHQQQHQSIRRRFPVLSRIAGMDWIGYCQYIGADLQPVSELKLNGGLRFDFVNDTDITMSTSLVFPNGKSRKVVMQSTTSQGRPLPTTGVVSPSSTIIENDCPPTSTTPSIVELHSLGGGPIYMRLIELIPDTILFHEIEKSTGNVILTGTLSIVVEEGKNVEARREDAKGMELIQVSHELFTGNSDTNTTSATSSTVMNQSTVKGHQVWRFTSGPS